jgi:hypothetical protein
MRPIKFDLYNYPIRMGHNYSKIEQIMRIVDKECERISLSQSGWRTYDSRICGNHREFTYLLKYNTVFNNDLARQIETRVVERLGSAIDGSVKCYVNYRDHAFCISIRTPVNIRVKQCSPIPKNVGESTCLLSGRENSS